MCIRAWSNGDEGGGGGGGGVIDKISSLNLFIPAIFLFLNCNLPPNFLTIIGKIM